MTKARKFISLDAVLSRDNAELTALKQDEFYTEKLGWIPFTALDNSEYKQIKKDSVVMKPNGTGGMEADVDDNKMMVRAVIRAVDKDTRSNFTFANKQLLEKLGVATADQAVEVLLAPGEIYRFGIAIQEASGFGDSAQKDNEEAVKN